jgi:hypothetical protein
MRRLDYFEGDALAALIFETLTDRGMTREDACDALENEPPSWDGFASRFVDPYEDNIPEPRASRK